MPDRIIFHISGQKRWVDAESTLKHLAKALRGYDLEPGMNEMIIDQEGGIYLNAKKVYTPTRPLIAAKRAG